jgi:hypothetical protein
MVALVYYANKRLTWHRCRIEELLHNTRFWANLERHTSVILLEFINAPTVLASIFFLLFLVGTATTTGLIIWQE